MNFINLWIGEQISETEVFYVFRVENFIADKIDSEHFSEFIERAGEQ
jgi:hypothetical protein